MAPKEHLTIRVMSAGVRNSARSLIDAVKHLGPKGTERPARTAQPKTDIGHRNLWASDAIVLQYKETKHRGSLVKIASSQCELANKIWNHN